MAIIRGENQTEESFQKSIIRSMGGLVSDTQAVSKTVGSLGKRDFATAKNQTAANNTLTGILNGIRTGFSESGTSNTQKIQLQKQTMQTISTISSSLNTLNAEIRRNTAVTEKASTDYTRMRQQMHAQSMSEMRAQTAYLSSISTGISDIQKLIVQYASNPSPALVPQSGQNQPVPQPGVNVNVDIEPLVQAAQTQIAETVRQTESIEGMRGDLGSFFNAFNAGFTSTIRSLSGVNTSGGIDAEQMRTLLTQTQRSPLPSPIQSNSGNEFIPNDVREIIEQMRGENSNLAEYTKSILEQMKGINSELANSTEDILEEMSLSQQEQNERTSQVLNEMRREGSGSDAGLFQKWDDFINNIFGKEFLGGMATFSGAVDLISNSISNSNEVAKKISLNLGENISQQGRMTYSHAYTDAADRNAVGGMFAQRITKRQYDEAMANAVNAGAVDPGIITTATAELSLFNTLMPEVNAGFDGFIRENATIFEDGEDRIRATTMLIKEYSENYQVTASALYRTVGRFEGTIKQFSGSTEEYAQNIRRLLEEQSKLEESGLADLGIEEFIEKFYNEGAMSSPEMIQKLQTIANNNDMSFTELTNQLLTNKDDPSFMYEMIVRSEMGVLNTAREMFDDTTIGGQAAFLNYISDRAFANNYLELQGNEDNYKAFLEREEAGDRVTAFDNGNIIETSQQLATDTLKDSVWMSAEDQMKAQADYNAESLDQTFHIADTAYKIGMDTTKILGTLKMMWGTMTMLNPNSGGFFQRLFGSGTVNPTQNQGGIRGALSDLTDSIRGMFGLGPRPVVDTNGNPVPGNGQPGNNGNGQPVPVPENGQPNPNGNSSQPGPAPIQDTLQSNNQNGRENNSNPAGPQPIPGQPNPNGQPVPNQNGQPTPNQNGQNSPSPNPNRGQNNQRGQNGPDTRDLTNSIETVRQRSVQIIQSIGDRLRTFGTNALRTLGRIGSSILAGAQSLFGKIRTGLNALGNTRTGQIFQKIGSGIVTGVRWLGGRILSAYQNMLASHGPAIKNAFGKFGSFIQNSFSSLWGHIKNGTSSILSFLNSKFPNVTSTLANGIDTLINGLKTAGGKIADAGKSVISTVTESLTGAATQSVTETLTEGVTDTITETVTETVTDTISDSVIDTAEDAISDGIDTLADNIGKKGKKGKKGKLPKAGKGKGKWGGIISGIASFAIGMFTGGEAEGAEEASDSLPDTTDSLDILDNALPERTGPKLPKIPKISTLGNALIGAAPGALLAAGGAFGAVKGVNEMQESTKGNQGTASAVQGAGGTAAVAGGALATAGGIAGIAGGVGAAMAGATGMGALMAGLSAIPVFGWVGAAVMGAGIVVSEAADHYKKLNKGVAEVTEAFDANRDALKSDAESRKETADQLKATYSSLSGAADKAQFLTSELGMSAEEIKNVSEAQMDVYANHAVKNEEAAAEDGGFWYKLTHWGKGKAEVANDEMEKAAQDEMKKAQDEAVSGMADKIASTDNAAREGIIKDLGLDEKISNANIFEKAQLESIKNTIMTSDSAEDIEKALNKGTGFLNSGGTLKDTLTIGKIENLSDKYGLDADVSGAAALTENGLEVSRAIRTLEAYSASADTGTLKGDQREEYINALNTIYADENKAALDALSDDFDIMKYRDIRTEEEKGSAQTPDMLPAGIESDMLSIAPEEMLSPMHASYNYFDEGFAGTPNTMAESAGGFLALGSTSNINDIRARAEMMSIEPSEYMDMQRAAGITQTAPGLNGEEGFISPYDTETGEESETEDKRFIRSFEESSVSNPALEGVSMLSVVQGFESTVASKLDELIAAVQGKSNTEKQDHKFGTPSNPTDVRSPIYQPKIERPLDQQNILNYAK